LEIRKFVRGFVDDLEELSFTFGKHRILQYFRDNSQFFGMNSDFLVVLTYFNGFDYTLLPYTTTTTAADIIEQLKRHNPNVNLSDCGLFISEIDNMVATEYEEKRSMSSPSLPSPPEMKQTQTVDVAIPASLSSPTLSSVPSSTYQSPQTVQNPQSNSPRIQFEQETKRRQSLQISLTEAQKGNHTTTVQSHSEPDLNQCSALSQPQNLLSQNVTEATVRHYSADDREMSWTRMKSWMKHQQTEQWRKQFGEFSALVTQQAHSETELRQATSQEDSTSSTMTQNAESFTSLDIPQVLVPSGFWIPPDMPISELHLSNQILCEFKFQPWVLVLRFRCGNNQVPVVKIVCVDPNRNVGDLLVELLKLFASDTSQFDYGLYYYPDLKHESNKDWKYDFFNCLEEEEGKCLYLSKADPLAKYDLRHRKGFFELRPKYLSLQVQLPPKTLCFAEGSNDLKSTSPHNEILYVDPQITESEFTKKLTRKYNVAENWEDYGVQLTEPLTRSHSQQVWIDRSSQLNSMKLTPKTVLKLFRRFLMIQIQFHDKEQPKKLKVDFAIPIIELLKTLTHEISHKFDCSFEGLTLIRVAENVKLNNSLSLLEQHVKENEVLAIAEKKTPALSIRFPKFTLPETFDWDELDFADDEQNSDTKIIYCKSDSSDEIAIVAATIDKLLINLMNTKLNDKVFLHPFLATLVTMINPEDFIDVLVRFFGVPESKPPNFQRRIKMRVCFILGHWLEKYLIVEDQRLWSKLEHFIHNIVKQDPIVRQEPVVGLLQSLYSVKKDDYTNSVEPLEGPPVASSVLKQKEKNSSVSPSLSLRSKSPTSSPKTMTKLKRMLARPIPPSQSLGNNVALLEILEVLRIELRTEDIAQQLTLKQWQIFSRVKITELLNQNWLTNKESHVTQMINLFNDVASWVATCITMEVSLRNRVALYCKFVKIARSLRKLNNFHLLTAVLSGLNNFAVTRLNWTLSRVPKQYLTIQKDLEDLLDMKSSYRNFRILLANAIPPCIPYIGLAMRDLTFIDEGQSDFTTSDDGEKLINFSKRRQVFELLTNTVLKYQQGKYDIQYEANIQEYLTHHMIKYDDDFLEQQSYAREPRNAARVDIVS
jgi:hypothetical protein